MARIGCLIHLQKQIPKYNHNYLSVLVNRSFYYVSAETSYFYPDHNYYYTSVESRRGRISCWDINRTKHGVNYIKVLSNNGYIEHEIRINGLRLRLRCAKTTISISASIGMKCAIYWFKNNTIGYTSHDWIDNRFLTTDRSVLMKLFRANVFNF